MKTQLKIDGIMVASVAALIVVGLVYWQGKKTVEKISETADALNPVRVGEGAGVSLANHCHALGYAPWYCIKPEWVN